MEFKINRTEVFVYHFSDLWRYQCHEDLLRTEPAESTATTPIDTSEYDRTKSVLVTSSLKLHLKNLDLSAQVSSIKTFHFGKKTFQYTVKYLMNEFLHLQTHFLKFHLICFHFLRNAKPCIHLLLSLSLFFRSFRKEHVVTVTVSTGQSFISSPSCVGQPQEHD